MCNTSSALQVAYSANKRVLSNYLKLFAVNSGSRSSLHRQFQAARPASEKARRPYVERLCRGTSSWRRLAERRWRRDATSEIGVHCAAVGQVRRSLAMETVIHHRHEFVLYSLRNTEPMKVVMHKLGQSTIKLLRTTEKTCCSIQKTL